MRIQSLEDLLQTGVSPVDLLRNSQAGPRVFPVIPPQFTNWIEEQRAWRESCTLMDQSHHMTNLFLEGPDAVRLLSDLGVNSFDNFGMDKGKHFVACNHDGYLIGDVILYYLNEITLDLVGRPTTLNWVQYNLETGRYDVTSERDVNSAIRQGPPKLFRYQIQGPYALEVMEKVTRGPLPDVGFFNVSDIGIAGRKVRALRHGMAGQPGYELSGAWEYGEDVRGAILEAGRDYGLRQVGGVAYPTATMESGWIPCLVPAIYTGEKLKAYREWLPADSYEGTVSLGGSFYSEDISDYYVTPYDFGYGRFVKFDHDFVGREALEEMADQPRREKVTLVWNSEDVIRAFATLFEDGDPVKYVHMPLTWHSIIQYDTVLRDGETVGVSTVGAYTVNERAILSLATVDVEHSEPGTEVSVLWGEQPISMKPQMERHVQMEIRATVAPVPYAAPVRAAYRT